MEREFEYNTALTKLRHTNYVRNHRAIVVLWALFVVIALVLDVVVFLQPQWIGDTGDSAVAGFFGAWEYCQEPLPGVGYTCRGDFLVWDSILNSAFQITSLMVGISCLLLLVSVGCFLLFCLLDTSTVLRVCAWCQFPACILMALACIIYPSGWDDPNVRYICGQQAGEYELGVCGLRWGYVLAIVGVLDAFILAVLALVLANTTGDLLPDHLKKEKAPEPRIVAPRKHHKPHHHLHDHHHQPVQLRHVTPVEYEEQQIAYLDPDDVIYDDSNDVTDNFFLNEFVMGSAGSAAETPASPPPPDTPRPDYMPGSMDLTYARGVVNDGFLGD